MPTPEELDEFARKNAGEQQMPLFSDPEAEARLQHYERLHDGLSDMIEGGRLSEADIPDDYQWLVHMLTTVPGSS